MSILKSATFVNQSRQRGVVLLLLMLLIIVSASYSLLVRLNVPVNRYTREDSLTQEALRLARQGLIGYAIHFPEIDSSGGTGEDEINGPGYLPCPDRDKDGIAVGSCSHAGATTIGRLPYKTLEIADLRDGSGARLWYALSDNFRNNPALVPLNSEVPGQLEVDGQDDIVAVIIAPGEPLSGQERDPAEGEIAREIEHYLDEENRDGDQVFAMGEGVNGNDSLLVISRRDLMRMVQKRVLGELRAVLRDYRAVYQTYPWLSPFADPKSVSRRLMGRADHAGTTLKANDNNFIHWHVNPGDMIYNLSQARVGTVADPVDSDSIGLNGLTFDEGDRYLILPSRRAEALQGQASQTGDQHTLHDAQQAFKGIGIAIGDVVDNINDRSSSVITQIDTGELTLRSLTGGTDNHFQTGDRYVIRSHYGIATNTMGNPDQLEDSDRHFERMGIRSGDIVRNLDRDRVAVITAVEPERLSLNSPYWAADNLFEAGDGYAISRFNAKSGTQYGHLPLHEPGEAFPSIVQFELAIDTLAPGEIAFSGADFPEASPDYRSALEAILDHEPVLSIEDEQGICVWSMPEVAQCYASKTEGLLISGTVTSGLNQSRLVDSEASFIRDGVKRGDIVQNYDDEIFVLNGIVDAGSRGYATADSHALLLADSGNHFVQLDIVPGDIVYNLTDGSSGEVVAVNPHQLVLASLSGGADNQFEVGDEYQLTDDARLYDAEANLEARSVVPYQYVAHNDSTNIRGVVALVNNPHLLTAITYENHDEAIQFSAGDEFSIHTAGLVVIDDVVDEMTAETNRFTDYIPDFDLLGDYQEFYRIIPASHRYSGSVDQVVTNGSVDTLMDDNVDFLSIGVRVGDVIEDTSKLAFGQITEVTRNTIRTRLYGAGGEMDFSVADGYTLYYRYVQTRRYEIEANYIGDLHIDPFAGRRVRTVCVGYTVDCLADDGVVSLSGNRVVIRDYQADEEEVGRVVFAAETSRGRIKTSKIDFYFTDFPFIGSPNGDIPMWFVQNGWHALTYIAYDPGVAPDALSSCGTLLPCLSLCVEAIGSDCGAAGGSANHVHGVVIATGAVLAGQDRSTAQIDAYLESDNRMPDAIFRRHFAVGTFNDQVIPLP